MWKPMLICMLATVCMLACEKESPEAYHETEYMSTSEISVDIDQIDTNAQGASIYSSLNELNSIGICYTTSEMSTYASPLICVTETNGYFLWNTPEEAAQQGYEAVKAFQQSEEYIHEIEVYPNNLLTGEPEVIKLTGLEKKVKFHLLSYHEETESFRCLGYDTYLKAVCYYHFDKNGVLVQRTELEGIGNNFQRLFNYCRLDGDRLYCMFPEENFNQFYPECDLYVYNITENTQTLIDTNVVTMELKSDALYYMKQEELSEHEDKERLYRLNLDTLKNTQVSALEGMDYSKRAISYLSVDEVNNVMYFSDLYEVYAYTLNDDRLIPVMRTTGPCIELNAMQGSTIYCTAGMAQYRFYELPEVPESYLKDMQPLRFMRYYPSDIVDEIEYPDTFDLMYANGYLSRAEIKTITNKEEYANTIAKKLLAGDTDFDIFFVSTEMAQLFNAQFYEDLAKYSLLEREFFDKMIPGLRDICTVDGVTCLIPTNLYTNMLILDNSMTSQPVTIPATFAEFTALMDSVKLKDNTYFYGGAMALTMFREMFEEFAANYIMKEMDDEQALTDLISLYDTCLEILASANVIVGYEYQQRDRLFSTSRNDGITVPGEGLSLGSLPKISDAYSTPVCGEFWAINPNSPNKELAAIFLTCFMARNRSYEYGGYAQYFINDAVDEPTELQKLFMKQVESGIRSYEATEVSDYLYKQFPMLENGSMTTEAAAKDLLRYLKMVRDE